MLESTLAERFVLKTGNFLPEKSGADGEEYDNDHYNPW